MFKRLIIAAVIAAASLAVPAAAADLGSFKDSSQSPVADPERPSFAGFSVGVSVQWDRLDVDHSGSLDIVHEEERTRFIDAGFTGIDGDGIGFGAQAGYQWQIGRVYFGPRIRGSWSDAEASMDASGIRSLTFFGEATTPLTDQQRARLADAGSLTVSNDWQAIADLKLGLAVTDRIGIYGFVGYGAAGLEATATANVNGGISTSHDETASGLVYGAGVDLKITQNLEAFVEYQRFDLGSFSASGVVPTIECLEYGYKADVNLDAVRVGLNYRF